MSVYRLLAGKVISATNEKRRFVQWRVQKAGQPREQLRIDTCLYTAKKEMPSCLPLDVYSRIIGQVLRWHIRKEHVIWLLPQVIVQHHTRQITLRNDNGSQFVLTVVREYLKDRQVNQEFTYVATAKKNKTFAGFVAPTMKSPCCMEI